MGQTHFNSRHAFSFGFDTVFANLGFFVPLMIGPALISFILLLVASFWGDSTFVSLVSLIVNIVVGSIIALALLKISLGFVDTHQLSRRDLFGDNKLLLNFITASLIFGIAVYIGRMLLIVPGIYILITYCLYSLEIIDRGFGPIEALRRSAELTEGTKWNMFLLSLEFYFGFSCIAILLFILVLFPIVSIGVIIVFLQAMGLSVFSAAESVLALMAALAGILVVLLMMCIAIPSYALAFACIYRSLEPRPSDAVEISPVQVQDGDG